VFHTQVDKLKRDMSKKNCPASAASCAFIRSETSSPIASMPGRPVTTIGGP
jgi:hypothetical protein